MSGTLSTSYLDNPTVLFLGGVCVFPHPHSCVESEEIRLFRDEVILNLKSFQDYLFYPPFTSIDLEWISLLRTQANTQETDYPQGSSDLSVLMALTWALSPQCCVTSYKHLCHSPRCQPCALVPAWRGSTDWAPGAMLSIAGMLRALSLPSKPGEAGIVILVWQIWKPVRTSAMFSGTNSISRSDSDNHALKQCPPVTCQRTSQAAPDTLYFFFTTCQKRSRSSLLSTRTWIITNITCPRYFLKI